MDHSAKVKTMTGIPAESAVRTGGNRDAYDHRLTPVLFDLIIKAVFAPFGGIHRLRSRALDLLGLKPGMRILELGCGTGGITQLLLERNVSVTAIDGSERMLSRARRQAPDAQFLCSRLEEYEPDGSFDRVIFAFVLHELAAPEREVAIAAARQAVKPQGVVAVLDWAAPSTESVFALMWRWFLSKLEPSSVADCLERRIRSRVSPP
jgi:ubiquinone/menaquinone biosynthesis C-methylase UbiE